MPGPKREKRPSGAPSSASAEQANDALRKALRFISYRLRSIEETIEKLKAIGFEAGVITDVVSRLSGAGYLDDERFARELAGSRIRNKHWGIKRIALDLRSKGIPDDIIRSALSGVDASAEEQTAASALEKWIRKTGVKFPLEKKELEKAFRHLAGRGFPAHVVMGTLKKGGRPQE